MTLLEIVIVSVVLGVLLVSSLPRFSQTAERLRVERGAAELAQLFRYAHARSIAEGKTVLWRWDESSRQIQLSTLTLDGTETPLSDRFKSTHPLDALAEFELSDGEEPIDEGRFFPDGTAERATARLAYRQIVYTVQVDDATGQISYTKGTADH